MHGQMMIGIRCRLKLPSMPGLNTFLLHQPCYPILPASDTPPAKLYMDTRAAVGFPAFFVDGLYVGDKPHVLLFSVAARISPPSIVAAYG